MLLVKDLLSPIGCTVDLYYKGSHAVEVKVNEHEWLRENMGWILDCKVISIDIEDDMLFVDTRDA